MRRRVACFATLLVLSASCSLSSLDDLKGDPPEDGGFDAIFDGPIAGGKCVANVDCAGCADCAKFCVCIAGSGVSACMQAVCGGGSGGSAGADSSVDSGDAASADASDEDASGGSGATGSVACGSLSCSTPANYCCIATQGGGDASCRGISDSCSGTDLFCDGPEDCPGAICCGTLMSTDAGSAYSVVECKASCSGGSQYVFCRTNRDCPASITCQKSATLPDYSVCK